MGNHDVPCSMCDGTGYKDAYGFCMDPCDHVVSIAEKRKDLVGMNIDIVKEHLKTGVIGTPLIILEDMKGPVCVNAGRFMIARGLSLVDNPTEVELTSAILRDLEEKGHNSFAYYRMDENELRFGSMNVADVPTAREWELWRSFRSQSNTQN